MRVATGRSKSGSKLRRQWTPDTCRFRSAISPIAALINFGHAWVLHKRVMVRALAAAIVLVGAVGLYEMRDLLASGAMMVTDVAQGEFARAGFGIGKIEITGQALTSEKDIAEALEIGPQTSTLNFDADAARLRLLKLPAVATVAIRKVYPNELSVVLTEKRPIARWRVDGITYVVDAEGTQIAEDLGDYRELPLVVGDGAADDAMAMIVALDRHPTLQSGLAALSRIGDRRWDLIYYSGLRVQLPEVGVAQALDQLELYQSDYALLDRDVMLIDLRVPGMVALKPGEIAAKQIAEAEKAAKKAHKTKGSSEYETAAERKADPGPKKP